MVSWQWNTSVESPNRFITDINRSLVILYLWGTVVLEEAGQWAVAQGGWEGGGMNLELRASDNHYTQVPLPVSSMARLPLLFHLPCVFMWLACSLFCFQSSFSVLEWGPSFLSLCWPCFGMSACEKQNHVQTSRLRTQLTLLFFLQFQRSTGLPKTFLFYFFKIDFKWNNWLPLCLPQIIVPDFYFGVILMLIVHLMFSPFNSL